MRKCMHLLLLSVVFPALLMAQAGGDFISFNDRKISIEGRVGKTDSCIEMSWSGTNISIRVKSCGTVKALLADSHGNNFYYVIVDGNESSARKIIISKEKQLYTLASFADNRTHHVQLFKITNTDDHVTRFYGFKIDDGGKVLKPARKPKRKIEFFGNSITCGHGVDVPKDSADSGAPQYFNNYKAYGAITARHFNAQYHCTSKSGIGVMVSWFPQVMPEIYDRVDPNDSAQKWDFRLYQPGIVVVNLLQNDSWIVNMPGNEEFKKRFGTTKPTEAFIVQAYANFIAKLRSKYPHANIICVLGNMDATRDGSKWPGYVRQAVASLNDRKIITYFFKYKDTPGHPTQAEQKAMADELIAMIEKGIWKRGS